MTLRAQVDAFLAEARPGEGPPPKALVAPHAGYMYSGAIAAAAYAAVSQPVRRVVLLGPAHYLPFRGLALPDAEAMRTPLGDVEIDRDALPDVRPNAAAHAREHSLEAHLPFLQRRFGEVSLVPLVVGDAAPGDRSRVVGYGAFALSEATG